MSTIATRSADRRLAGFRYTPDQIARTLELYRAGLTDRQIVARLPDVFDTAKQVSGFRYGRRLPRNNAVRDFEIQLRGATRRQVRETATAYGLPDDLLPAAVALLLALADGPRTAPGLAAAVGTGIRNVYSRIGDLQARGLVVGTPGRGRYYLLSAAAMTALAGEGRGE